MSDRARVFYAELWPHAAALLRTAQILCRNPADADDLVQEVLLKAYAKLQQYRPGTDARRWLMTILRTTHIDRLRGASVLEVSLDEMFAVAAPEVEAQLLPEQWADSERLLQQLSDEGLIALLKELPEEVRWSLLLVDVEGLSMADAAGVMDVPEGTVKSRLHRGRGMLRARLVQENEQPLR